MSCKLQTCPTSICCAKPCCRRDQQLHAATSRAMRASASLPPQVRSSQQSSGHQLSQRLPLVGMAIAAASRAADGSIFLASSSDAGIRCLRPVPFLQQVHIRALRPDNTLPSAYFWHRAADERLMAMWPNNSSDFVCISSDLRHGLICGMQCADMHGRRGNWRHVTSTRRRWPSAPSSPATR